MFPLGTVLFPGMLLPLHIFEERYRVMIRRVLEGDRSFGVVLIERGHEVGGGDQRFPVGTAAHVVEAREAADGRWAVIAAGGHRLRVQRWLADDPHPQAEVELLPEAGAPPEASVVVETERALARVRALQSELGEPPPPPQLWAGPDDAVPAAWRLPAQAPVGELDRQRLLEVDDHTLRLERLRDMLVDEAAMLALRLGQG